MSRYQLRQGIIIRRQVQTSGDIMVTVLSPAEAPYPIKWRGVARKGGRLDGNSARLNLFHDIQAQVYQKPQQSIGTITQVSLNGALSRLSMPQRYSCAHVLAELADSLSSEDSSPHYQFYEYLASGLRGIAHHPDPEKVSILYAWRLLAQAGLAPDVSACHSCGRLEPISHLHIAAGGVSCAHCALGLPLPPEVLQEIIRLHHISTSQALTLPLAERTAHWRALSRYIVYHVQPLRSLAQLRPHFQPDIARDTSDRDTRDISDSDISDSDTSDSEKGSPHG